MTKKFTVRGPVTRPLLTHGHVPLPSMSDAPISRDEEMLARVAELDLAAAEKVHARLMAAEVASDIAELGRTYQRMTRSLRQTLALKAKLALSRSDHAVRAGLAQRRHDATFDTPAHHARVRDLQEAVERVA